MNKLCPKCGIVKSYNEYNKSTKAKDGLQSSCRDCRSAAQRLARSTEAGRAKDIRYRNSRLGKETARNNMQVFRQNRPEYVEIYNTVGNAVRSGKLIKGLCEVCGNPDVQAHHDDYNFVLNVRWLCNKHHAEWHRNNNPILRN